MLWQLFAQRGVAEIGEFFTDAELADLCLRVERKTRQGLFRSMNGDAQVPGAPCEYADQAAETLLAAKTDYLSELLRLDLVPTYSYLRLYRLGDRLAAHRDRPACEITVSAPLLGDCAWPLHILAGPEILSLCPAPRGAVVFKGHELLHWRDELSTAGLSAHVFFHYVRRNGAHASWASDRRTQPC